MLSSVRLAHQFTYIDLVVFNAMDKDFSRFTRNKRTKRKKKTKRYKPQPLISRRRRRRWGKESIHPIRGNSISHKSDLFASFVFGWKWLQALHLIILKFYDSSLWFEVSRVKFFSLTCFKVGRSFIELLCHQCLKCFVKMIFWAAMMRILWENKDLDQNR